MVMWIFFISSDCFFEENIGDTSLLELIFDWFFTFFFIVATRKLISGDKVALLVENTRFLVDPNVLTAKPDTMLGRMFSVRSKSHEGAELVRPNEHNEYEVAEGISAPCFQAILVSYLEYNEVKLTVLLQ